MVITPHEQVVCWSADADISTKQILDHNILESVNKDKDSISSISFLSLKGRANLYYKKSY